MQNIKSIIFDIDDTLVQTIKCKWTALKETGKKYYNLTITDKDIKKYWGLPFKTMLKGIFSNIDSFETIQMHYVETSKDFPMKAHQGAVEVINYLKDRYLIAALTASSRTVILKDLEDSKFSLKDFFFIQTSEDTTYHKPDPKVFIPIITKLKNKDIEQKNIIYIGDGLRDYEAAKKAGLDFIAVTTGVSSMEAFSKAGVERKNILENLHELPKNLLSICKSLHIVAGC